MIVGEVIKWVSRGGRDGERVGRAVGFATRSQHVVIRSSKGFSG